MAEIEAHVDLGIAYTAQGFYVEAERSLETALELDPHDSKKSSLSPAPANFYAIHCFIHEKQRRKTKMSIENAVKLRFYNRTR